MLIFWILIVIALFLGGFYLKVKIEEKSALKEIRKVELDESQKKSHLPKMTVMVNGIIKYTVKIGKIFIFPIFAIFRSPVLQPYEQQKNVDRWIKMRILIGGIVVYTMAIGNILLAVFYFLWISTYGEIFLAILYILVQSALSIALIFGWNWTRILLGLGAVWWGLLASDFAIGNVLHGSQQVSFLRWTVAVIFLVGGAMLLFSKSVKYFIYYRKEVFRRPK